MEKKRPSQPDRKTVTLGDQLKPALAALAAGRAPNMSALIRRSVAAYLGSSTPQVDPRPIVEALAALRLSLGPVGSNLNQLAHGFNVDPRAFNRDALATSHAELREEFSRVMGKLLEIERALRKR